MVKKIFILIFLFFFTPGFLFCAAPPAKEAVLSASEFTLSDLEGREISLSDFRGKPVVLLFWAISCFVCRQNLQELNGFYPELSAEGIKLLAINIYEPPAAVKRFADRHGLAYSVLLDEDAAVADKYGIIGIPTYIIINKEGRVVFQDHYFPRRDYRQMISR